ncbi:MAG: SDR family NAD(P)-dependent oxidoreductase [Flavobacteriia bacterium]|jgi:NADP-dependent 3-hydroxy acid dehydrogenase YdfG
MNNLKTAFITGATSGFGKACAEIFAANGWNLIITGRRNDRLITLKEELEKQFGNKITTLCFDVRNLEEVNDAIEKLKENEDLTIDLLINNAGLAVGRGPIQDGLTDDWERMIDTNIKGLLFITKAIAPLMIAQKNGHIINISSIAGKEVYPGGNVYCASKFAVDALSKSMRMDLVEFGIKVTNIAPGAAETEFSLVRFKGDENTAKNVYNGFEPLSAEDIADTIYFVATRPAHVTINDLTIMPTAQASSTIFHKK